MHTDAHASLRSKAANSRYEEAPSDLGIKVIKHQDKEAGAKSGNTQSDKQAKSSTSLLDRRYTLD